MTPHTIEFKIKPDGTIEEHVIGVCGPECAALTQPFEAALGQTITQTATDEFYQESQQDDEQPTGY